jgi:hypothetical protein
MNLAQRFIAGVMLRSTQLNAVGTAEFRFSRPYGTPTDPHAANPALKGGANIVPASGRLMAMPLDTCVGTGGKLPVAPGA